MYNSPIRTAVMHSDVLAKVNEDVDGLIISSVVHCGVSVDKEELLRALQYDRGQYDAGYRDGIAAAEKKLVRCKDCRYWDDDRRCNGIKNGLVVEYTDEDDFCSYGERRSE